MMPMYEDMNKQVMDFWTKLLKDSGRPIQSPEQMRREWLKTLKTDELWGVHDDLIKELRSRT
jgi:hypothetical protein